MVKNESENYESQLNILEIETLDLCLEFQAALKSKNQFPIMSRDSFLIKPGYETLIAITATHTTARF